MKHKIFISYRRDDSAGYAGRLYSDLAAHFDAENVFLDIHAIETGAVFPDSIQNALSQSDVLLAVIGKQWASIKNEKGELRLHVKDDLVRKEIATALQDKKLVIPILVRGATMPNSPDLPEDLRPITLRNAIELSDHRWDYDIKMLLPTLRERINIWKHPYKFLDFFTAEDKAYFFGREIETSNFRKKIHHAQTIVLYGRSGVGKTSLLRAGVIPELEADNHACLYTRFGHDPEWSIKRKLAKLLEVSQVGSHPDMGLSLPEYVNEVSSQFSSPIIIIIDQFEEFELFLSKVIRRSLAKALGEIAQNNAGSVKFVFSIREDFLGILDELRPFFANPLANTYRLINLSRDGAEKAIVNPAQSKNLTFEKDALDLLIKGLEEKSEAKDDVFPPHLQIVCYQLLNALPDNTHTISSTFLNQLGGVEKLLADYVQSALAPLEPGDQDAARDLLKMMVSSAGTKIMKAIEELSSVDNALDLLQILIERRLVRRIAEKDSTYYELAHDQLAELVKSWINLQEQSAKEIEEMLAQEISNQSYSQKRGNAYFIDPIKLERVYEQGQNPYIKLDEQTKNLLFSSAFHYVSDQHKQGNGNINLQFWLKKLDHEEISRIIYNLITNTDNYSRYIEALQKNANLLSQTTVKYLLGLFRPMLAKNGSEKIKSALVVRALRRQASKKELLKAFWIILSLSVLPRLIQHIPQVIRNLLLFIFIVILAAVSTVFIGKTLCVSGGIDKNSFICETLNPSVESVKAIEPLEHDMAKVPMGTFIAGTEDDAHTETLSTYYIDRYEVTNAQYIRCVDAGVCRPPVNSVFDLDEYTQHPVTNVTLDNAKTYCEWINGALPSNLQWEKAARGQDGYEYPWGNTKIENEQANICDMLCPKSIKVENINDGFSGTSPVGNFPNGASPYGVEDMVGNVWEWTADGYARGGSWTNDRRLNKATSLTELPPDARDANLGFRCVRAD